MVSLRTTLLSVAVATIPLLVPTKASATIPQLVCRVFPPNTAPYSGPYCASGTPSASYQLSYQLQNTTGATGFVWTRPAKAHTVESGCGTTNDYCRLRAYSSGADKSFPVSVTVTTAAGTTTYTAEADIPAVCGQVLC
ncbi:hypothetical protein [Actinokineospora sp. NBRC 105648]|uniref:hypothetical protein n=1 Tax=Actinokineospora sp. NBRC 105648 TaxID=3032206 RepID=UPI00249FDB71|nr:hypothetical protein [Actinokineospora sp. NBRC 105648]GLZ43353.1 hypothetical protein Acsp05_69770 [Actinokineospora sp. NBRC 105648]